MKKKTNLLSNINENNLIMNLPFIRVNPLGVVVLCALLLFLIYLYTGASDKNAVSTVVSLKHLLSVSVTAAELGGLKVQEIRKSADLKQKSKGKTKEGANDPVTYGDLLSHRVMLHTLKNSFPNIEVVSEEHDDSEINFLDINHPIPPWNVIDKFSTDIVVPVKDVLIWIDPLDATQEYTENLLQYVTTMICVAIKGKPVIGVVHKPFQNSTVWGWVGKGLSDPNYASGEKRDPNKSPTIIVSRSHAGKVKEVARAAFGPDTEVIPAGGAGYKSLQVIEGKADAYIHVTLIKKWDICPGNALLNAVGGKMTTLDGSDIDYGDSSTLKNEKGLIAALYDHQKFVNKLANLAS